jgi:isopentenyl phosphate kinase
MHKLYFIKIGGSLITEKSQPEYLRRDVIANIAKQLAKVFRSRDQNVHFVIGVGAGSYGHYYAKEYGLTRGAINERSVFGVCKTHRSVQKLASVVINELLSFDLPAFMMSPANLFLARDGELSGYFIEPLKTALAHNMIPLVHGETVLDETRGTTIFSTEQTFEELIKLLPNYQKSVILLTDVDGVLGQDGQTIEVFDRRTSTTFFANNNFDVTGNMEQKVAAALRMAESCNQVVIADGRRDNIIENILNGDLSRATVITATASSQK